jgi:hypothetical protein
MSMSPQAAARSAPAEPEHVPPRPRRTVEIRGQGAPAPVIPLRPHLDEAAALRSRDRKRPRPAPARPDRIAMWAVILGIFMVIVAATSAHGATLAPAPAPHVLVAPAR